ncbi:MAG TPA: MFS transporter, partial [Ornithinibacter sp.]|nr:MFS transporter [Ornithinibacter sp.]
LPAGAWVDRSDARRVMIAADLGAAVSIGSVPVAWALGVLTLPHLVVAALGVGTASVFLRTAYLPLVPRLVAPGDLATANARLVGTESAMQVVGPGLGGALVALASAAYAVVADVLSFLVSALCLHLMDRRRLLPASPPAARESLRTEVATGIRVVAHDRFLRFFTLQGGVSNFALTGYAALLVLFLVRDLDLDPRGIGLVMSAGSVGGLVGASVAERATARLGDARAMVALQVVSGPPALLIALAQPGVRVVLVPLGLALVGLGVVGANVIRGTFRMRYTPPQLLARTTSASALVNFGTMPVAGLAAGWLGVHLGVRETIALMAGIHLLAALSPVLGPYGRLRELPAQPMATWSSGSTATARKTTVT